MNYVKSPLAILLVCFFSEMQAQNDSLPAPEFAKFDANHDYRIDPAEFSKMNAIYFQNSDPNQDRQLKMDEFQDYAFNQLDKNGDKNLDRDEWKYGRDSLFKDCMAPGHFENYDANGDKTVTKPEFNTAFAKTRCFHEYDKRTNGKIDVKEMTNRYFEELDINKDGMLDKKEFEQYRRTNNPKKKKDKGR